MTIGKGSRVGKCLKKKWLRSCYNLHLQLNSVTQRESSIETWSSKMLSCRKRLRHSQPRRNHHPRLKLKSQISVFLALQEEMRLNDIIVGVWSIWLPRFYEVGMSQILKLMSGVWESCSTVWFWETIHSAHKTRKYLRSRSLREKLYLILVVSIQT